MTFISILIISQISPYSVHKLQNIRTCMCRISNFADRKHFSLFLSLIKFVYIFLSFPISIFLEKFFCIIEIFFLQWKNSCEWMYDRSPKLFIQTCDATFTDMCSSLLDCWPDWTSASTLRCLFRRPYQGNFFWHLAHPKNRFALSNPKYISKIKLFIKAQNLMNCLHMEEKHEIGIY